VITAAATIKAIAVKSGMTNSEVFSAAYTITATPSGSTLNLANTSPSSNAGYWTYSAGVYTITNGATVTITGDAAQSGIRGLSVKVAAGTANTTNITLDGASIDSSAAVLETLTSALDIEGAKVELTLAAGSVNTLYGGGRGAGIRVPVGAILTITGTGSLTASGYSLTAIASGAGIGGRYSETAGQINISGGIITATGGYSGAGIGGGGFDVNPYAAGSGGTIVISGAATVVTASGNGQAAGIGGGGSTYAGIGGDSGNITISGGHVVASGGRVVATHGNRGAAIGGGGGGTMVNHLNGNSGNISISAGVTGTLTKGASASYHVGPGNGGRGPDFISGDPVGTKLGTITIGAGAFNGQALDLPPP
jgi:hypothetical protein